MISNLFLSRVARRAPGELQSLDGRPFVERNLFRLLAKGARQRNKFRSTKDFAILLHRAQAVSCRPQRALLWADFLLARARLWLGGRAEPNFQRSLLPWRWLKWLKIEVFIAIFGHFPPSWGIRHSPSEV